MTKSIYDYLNSLCLTNYYEQAVKFGSNNQQELDALPQLSKSKIINQVASKGGNVFVYYHYCVSSIEIHASGIKNPKKLQSYLHLYPYLLAASISRLVQLLEDQDIVIIVIDSNTYQILNQIFKASSINSTNLLFIQLDDTLEARKPMWHRFHVIRNIANIVYEVSHSGKQVEQRMIYAIDSDYIPSSSLKSLFLNKKIISYLDILFTINPDSYPQWPINEGFYGFKANKKALQYFQCANFIYDILTTDPEVLRFWKDPKIWRGAQASLLLPAYEFNQFKMPKSGKIEIKSLSINTSSINVARVLDFTFNSPPDKAFYAKKWSIINPINYHLTGYHKQNHLTLEFLNYCINGSSK